MEPLVTIVTKFNNANLSTMTEKDMKDSKADLLAVRNSTGAIKKPDRIIPLPIGDIQSRKGS